MLQSLHADTPVAAEYLPDAHFWQVISKDAPLSSENFPAPHATHASSESLPASGRYFPAAQSAHKSRLGRAYFPALQVSQTVDPFAADAFPGAHGRHRLLFLAAIVVEYVPAGHPEQKTAPSFEYVPAKQSRHEVRVGSENLPARHFWHSWLPCDGAVLPASHILQSEYELAPWAEYLPAGHNSHVDSAVAPVAAENFPPSQSVHTLDPSDAAYFPARHDVQYTTSTAPTAPEYVPIGQSSQSSSELMPSNGKYLPAGQFSQESNDGFEYVPTLHCAQTADPGILATEPASQDLQVDLDVAAGTAEYFPVSHLSQNAAPFPEYEPATQSSHRVFSLFENVPATHCMQEIDPGLVETEPATHRMQAAEETAPICSEYVPASHFVQLVDPGVSEYLPFPQSTHKSFVGLEYLPTPQVSQREDPDLAAVPSLHSKQVVDNVAPIVIEYLPAAHSVHMSLDVAPGFSMYVPAGQAAHRLCAVGEQDASR